MLNCDGYKMFHGTVRVTPVILPDGSKWRDPFDLKGTWLFRPDTRVWYCQPDDKGFSISLVPEILSDFREE